jgi:SH3-like domain-containing protein
VRVLKRAALAFVLAAGLCVTAAEAERDRRPPYWASIATTKAMMRTGPGKNYPATWLYLRVDLPVKVIETYPDWRKVRDPDGETGWMLQRLLSDTRTALVRGETPRPLHEAPDEASKVRYLAEPGVVGRISRCRGGWCRLDVAGKAGYVRTEHIVGIDPGETIE